MHVICRLTAKLNHDRESVYHLQVILSPVSLNIQALLMSKHCIERTERFDMTFIHAIHSETKQHRALIGDAQQFCCGFINTILTFYNCCIKSVMFAHILIGINSLTRTVWVILIIRQKRISSPPLASFRLGRRWCSF